MQRWFFLEDPSAKIMRVGKGDASVSSESSESFHFTPRKWLFRVKTPKLKSDEVVCVVGDIVELGSWQPEKCIILNQEANSGIWSAVVDIPDKRKVQYRYCVCVIIEPGIQAIVRNWETSLKPRVIESTAVSFTVQVDPQNYGFATEREKIDRGWLITESVIQFKLCNNPLTLWRPKYSNRVAYIKVTPMNLLKHATSFSKSMSEALEESLSADTQDVTETAKYSYTEVANLNSEDSTFQPQYQFGTALEKDDMLIFQSTVLFPQNTAYLFDLYIYSSRGDNEPPYHAGFSYLLPTALQSSEGQVVLPVTSTKHRPLGEIRIDYLVIGPLSNFKCDMSVSYARHWKKTRAGLDVGHRGSGSSFKSEMEKCAEVRENTIASLRNAINHGADFVEFDVQLSKDLIPIIYHDFYVCISLKKKKELQESDMLELPLKELTLDQLKLLKVYHLSEGKAKIPRFFDEDLEEHQPFPTLQQALETLDPLAGFNIEIKWTMKNLDGTYELYHPTDLNLYLDTILEVVLRYGGERRIIFSCFNPDICQVIRIKQNKYPVMFLTVGDSQIYPRYFDPRCWSVYAATQYARMIEILGINVHTEDLLRDPSLIKPALNANLVTFCWGDENADPATIKFLKELGLHGVIYDKIYQHKEEKESIFLMESRNSQKEIMELVAATTESSAGPISSSIIKDNILDASKTQKENGHEIFREQVRIMLPEGISNATSLESLETSLSEYENAQN